MKQPNSMKCQYCDFTVARWRRSHDGSARSGYEKLKQHVLDHHIESLPPDVRKRLEEE